MRFWKAAWRSSWGVDVDEPTGDDGGEEVGEDGSREGACLLLRGRTVYVPVSQMSRDPVAGEAVSIRWFQRQ